MHDVTTTFAKLFSAIGEIKGCKFKIGVPVDISDLDIEFDTPTGYERAVTAIKKRDTSVILVTTVGDLRCASKHILFCEDGSEILARNLTVGSAIQTKLGITHVTQIENGAEDDFYDIAIDAPHHSYYDANGLLHHNTWMLAALTDILAENGIRTIVIVPSDDLVTQTAATLRLGLLDVGIYSGSTKDIYHTVVVGTWQALQNNPGLMNELQCLIVDEAHGAKAKVVGELINAHGKNIAYRFGFTGTMPKPEIDRLTLRGSIGDVLFEISAAKLMTMGYLAKLEIEPIEINEDVEEDFTDYSAEKTYLSKNPKRLDFLADLIIAKAMQYGNTFVLVNSIKQGKELQKRIKDSVFLHGADDSEVRAEWYSLFETRDDLIVIATFGIASTGISIDRVFCLCMIDAGKSFIRAIQSIGRGLRKGHDKDSVHCLDVHSKLKWSKRHFKERVKYYKDAKYAVSKINKFKL